MRKVVLIPTYWSRRKEEGWREGDAVYDHPTPIDEEGTLGRTLESMKILKYKDFKLVLLICPTTPEIAQAAQERVTGIVRSAGLAAETYLFTVSDLAKITDIICSDGVSRRMLSLLTMSGYANVRNMCLLCADILAADAAILIDDDEVFEKPDFIERCVEFLGKRVYGDVVYGIAGYYLNKKDQYYDDVKPESWMTYWDRFGTKARAFDEIIGCAPRIKRTPFAFGGAMVLHRDLFSCVPFDPHITRGEDIDYLINSRMYGFSFYLDNTLSIKHLPVEKKHPVWKRIREDIYRFVYEKAKLSSQYKTNNMVMVTAEDFDPYPGEFLRDDLDEMIFRSNTMLAVSYMQKGDIEGCNESLNNIAISRKEAMPGFDAFSRYRVNQKLWEQICQTTAEKRYELRKIMEGHNLSSLPIIRNEQRERRLSSEEIEGSLKNAFELRLSEDEWAQLRDKVFVKTYYEGEMVFRSGDFNNAMYILLKGEIALYAKADPAGTFENEIARLCKGDILGESCMTHMPFVLNGRAEQFTEMIGIKRDDIQIIVNSNPAVGVKLFQLMLTKVAAKLQGRNLRSMETGADPLSSQFVEGQEI